MNNFTFCLFSPLLIDTNPNCPAVKVFCFSILLEDLSKSRVRWPKKVKSLTITGTDRGCRSALYSGVTYKVQLRPYALESTGSRPISKVKLVTAPSVLWWGTTREYGVLKFLSFFGHQPPRYSINLTYPYNAIRRNECN